MPARRHSLTSTGSVRNVALLSAWTATRPRREGAPKVSCVYVLTVRKPHKQAAQGFMHALTEVA